MKRFLHLILSVLVGFLITEVLVGIVIGFPTYGVEYKVRYRNGGSIWTNVRFPHSAIFNVEGWRSVEFNNYGLPGSEIKSLDSLIVVLGSSFVEAQQYAAEHIATSVFQRKVDFISQTKQVMNLGSSGHDPYDSWFRLQYFEQKLGFDTEDVILVINSDNQAWFSRHPKPLEFEKQRWFGSINDSFLSTIQTRLRNSFSTFDLAARAVKSGANEETEEETPSKDAVSKPELSEDLKSCLNTLSMKYDRFKVLSIVSDNEFSMDLATYCESLGIEYLALPVVVPRNMINRAGHLNLQGNLELGEALYTLYI